MNEELKSLVELRDKYIKLVEEYIDGYNYSITIEEYSHSLTKEYRNYVKFVEGILNLESQDHKITIIIETNNPEIINNHKFNQYIK